MLPDLEILHPKYRTAYQAQTGQKLAAWQPHIPTVEFTADSFGFYTSVSAVFSSKIEGEHIDLDYYRNVHIGFDYDSLQYDRCLPMLLMLPQSLP